MLSERTLVASLTTNMADIDPDEPLFALKEENDSVQDLIDFALTTHVSDEVRKECEAEMERGRKSGWKRF